MTDMSIIGGADGPTAIFLAGKTGISWLNTFGLILVVLLLIPNIIYAIKVKDQTNRCTNKFMNVLEQIGRYGCMFLMVFNIGVAELGFCSVLTFLLYVFGNIMMMIMYWGIWMLYFHKPKYWMQMELAILPTCIFLLSGITMQHYLLVMSGVIFGVAHIYVTKKNNVENA